MKYFNSLPSTLNVSNNGNYVALKNLVVRSKLVTNLSKNPLVFYKYDIKDSDSPEIIAYKYYGDSYRYWLVLLANEIMDPLWNWPLTTNSFGAYLNDKYSAAAGAQPVIEYAQLTTHHYEKLITTYDDETQVTAIKNIIIDKSTYDALVEKSSTRTFSYGSNVSYKVTKKSVSIYDYETELNESKRSINLFRSEYVSDLESQFATLMGL